MSGFPVRPTRNAFGPTRTDDGVVTDHERCVAADVFNLEHWQVAGLGLTAPRALVLFDGATTTVLAAAETWDPHGTYAPALTRTGAGVYELTYAATYPDELGQSVATGIIIALAFPQEGARRATAIPRAGGAIVDVYTYDTAGAPTDARTAVIMW